MICEQQWYNILNCFQISTLTSHSDIMKPEHQIVYHTLQAQWWIASATTKHCLARKLYHSSRELGDCPFTDEEKIEDALKIAKSHIELVREISETMEE